MSKKMLVGKAIKFNPSESIAINTIAKKIPMGALTEFQRKINWFEYSQYNSGPKFRNGDTLVAKITPCLENGKTCFVDILDDNEVAFGSSEFIVLRRTEYTDAEFIYYFARSPLFRDRAINCMEGTSGRKRVNENTLKNLEFVFPDLPTQKSIAKALSDLDAKIELNNRINRELEAMAKTLYDYWFVQFDFPNEAGKPYKSSGGKMVYSPELNREMPEGWEVKRLVDIEPNIITGKTPSTNVSENFGGNIPFITIDDIRGNIFILNSERTLSNIGADSQPTKYLKNGDICVSCIGTIGMIGIVSQTSQSNQQINTISIQKAHNRFFLLNAMRNYFDFNIAAKKGAVLLNMNKTEFSEIPILDSLVSVKEKFNNLVQPMYKNIEINLKQNQTLSALRDWLLPMLMNGQVSVQA